MKPKKVRNLNKILSRSKNPELLLYKVVNNPKLRASLKKSNANLNNNSLCEVVNHPRGIRKITIIKVEVA